MNKRLTDLQVAIARGRCTDCLGCGWHCSNCGAPGSACECDDVERGSAEEWDCEACDGTGLERDEEG